jgi:hypothetical protein
MKALASVAKFAGLLALMLTCACGATVLDRAINVANFAGAFADKAGAELAEFYDSEQRAAVDEAKDYEDATAKVAAVRARFAPAWAAYDALRVSWRACAAAIRSAEAARKLGHEPSLDGLVTLAAHLTDAQAKFANAVYALTRGAQ